jgi:diguanylate cyclase (GGDEF)-like protein
MQEERRKQEQIKVENDKLAAQELIYKDDLTKLHNRRYLHKRLPEIIRQAAKNDYPLSLFMIDVDKFKDVNDTYGHQRGDKVLTEVSNLLRESFRDSDEIIRYAGDEFVVMLPTTEENDSLKIAKRLIGKVSQYSFIGDEGQPDLNLTLSLGMAVFPRDAQDAEKLIYRADEALYLSKRSGRNQVSVFADVPEDILNKNKILEIFPCQRIIARSVELAKIKQTLDVCFNESISKAILVSAEAGLGKTRIQSEIRKYAFEKESLCFTARCTEAISEQPYQVISANLERFLKSLKGEANVIMDSLADEEIVQLFDLEPALAEYTSKKIDINKSDEKNARFNLFNGLVNLLSKISEVKHFLISFDNFQWVDMATLSLINYMLVNRKDKRIAFMGALRFSELQRRLEHAPELKEQFDKLQNCENTSYLELKPFSIEEAQSMIMAIFEGMQFDSELLQKFCAKTEGNPYFIEESLKHFVEKGIIFFKDGGWQHKEVKDEDLSSGIKQILEQKVKNMDEETRQFLSNAAILGQEFALEPLEKMIGKNPGYIEEMIDRAITERLIESRESDGQFIYAFRNKLLWEVVYAQVKEEERDKLHGKFAEIAEQTSSANPQAIASLLAYHFKKAKDSTKANSYLKIAQAKADKSFNPIEANQYLQQVLSQELAGLKDEEEEELALSVEPLKNEDFGIVSQLIVSLKTGIVNFSLYPAGSKVRSDSIEEFYNLLSKLFNKYGVISFSEVEGFLLVNGKELKSREIKTTIADSLGKLLKDYRIQSLSFEKGISLRELDALFAALSKKTSEIEDLGGLPELFKAKGINKIKVNMVHYEKMLKKQLGRTQDKKRKINEVMLINYMLGRPQADAGSQVSMLDLFSQDPNYLAKIISEGPSESEGSPQDIDYSKMNLDDKVSIVGQGLKKINEEVSSEDEEAKRKFEENLPKFILSLQPDLRSQILRQKNLKNMGISPDDVSNAFINMSDDEISTFLKQEAVRFKEQKLTFDDLKDYVRRFLPEEDKRGKVLSAIKSEFQQNGLSDEQILNLLKPDLWRELSSDEKIVKIKELNSEAFLDQDVLESTKQIFYDLLADSREDEVIEVLKKILDNLNSDKKQVRNYISSNLISIIDILASNEAVKALKFIVEFITGVMEQENDGEIYDEYIKALIKLTSGYLKNKSFVYAGQLLDEVKKVLSQKQDLAEGHRVLLQKVLNTATEKEPIETAVNIFSKKVDKKILTGVMHILELAEENAVEPLLNVILSVNKKIDPFDAYFNRQYVSTFLKKYPKKTSEILRYRISATRDIEEICNIIEIMGFIKDPSCIPSLKSYMEYSNQDVRRKAKKAYDSIERHQNGNA